MKCSLDVHNFLLALNLHNLTHLHFIIAPTASVCSVVTWCLLVWQKNSCIVVFCCW